MNENFIAIQCKGKKKPNTQEAQRFRKKVERLGKCDRLDRKGGGEVRDSSCDSQGKTGRTKTTLKSVKGFFGLLKVLHLLIV